MWKTLGSFLCVGILACSARGQENPLAERFHRLMGGPKEFADQLLNYPWKTELPPELPGLRAAPVSPTIRIGSVERPLTGAPIRRRWASGDGKLWIDLVRFDQPAGAAVVLQGARQVHSGFIGINQLLLFSNTGDSEKEALGFAIARTDGSLLNIGMKLPVAVRWSPPLSAVDLAAFDGALNRFGSALDMVARAFLDPAYVTLGAKIEAKPEALSMLRMAGFARLWSYIRYNFVYLDRRPELNWDGVLEQYLPLIAAAKNDAEYGRILQKAVALLKDGHTGVYPNAADPHDSPALVLEPIGGKPVATLVGSLDELSPIKPGMELLEIDGRSVSDVIEHDVNPYIFSSTVQDRERREMFAVLDGVPGSTAHTRWLTLDGRVVDVAIPRNGSEHRAALKIPNRPRFDYRELAGGIAYIGLNTFNDHGVDSDFDASFGQLREAKAWIIDLRYNGGGSSEIGYGVLAHFINASVIGSKQSSRLYNATLAARNQPQSWYDWETDRIAPAPAPRYGGPVYVLTSPATCSAAEDFLIPLRAAKRITIIGEPSCGSTGQPLEFSIYGATARVCTKWDRFPDGTEFVGVGVIPDVLAARTKDDVATGRDTVLEAALRLASR